MNTINMPGFTAESSVYRTSGHYQMTAGFDANGGVVQPQACDADCARECGEGECGDLTGRQRLQCLRQCFNRCGCGPQPQVCGPCQCDPQTGWSQRCCSEDGTNCSQRSCTPPGEGCTVQDDRTCLPWPFDSICFGSCERTCCHWSGCDQLLCGVSECDGGGGGGGVGGGGVGGDGGGGEQQQRRAALLANAVGVGNA